MPCECVRADGLEEPDVSGVLTESVPIKYKLLLVAVVCCVSILAI
jgi:hypothetical protein